MERSPKLREKSPMYEACALLTREHDVSHVAEMMQKIWTSGSLGRRVRAAQRELCARPHQWTANRVSDLFRGKARKVESFEARTIAWLRVKQIEEAKREYAELTAIIGGLEETLLRIDPDFHSEAVIALRQSRGRASETLGGVDSAGDRGGDR